MGTAICGWIVF